VWCEGDWLSCEKTMLELCFVVGRFYIDKENENQWSDFEDIDFGSHSLKSSTIRDSYREQ